MLITLKKEIYYMLSSKISKSLTFTSKKKIIYPIITPKKIPVKNRDAVLFLENDQLSYSFH